jgi:hypothetical protein
MVTTHLGRTYKHDSISLHVYTSTSDGTVLAVWTDSNTGEAREQVLEVTRFVKKVETVQRRLETMPRDEQVPWTLLCS